MMKMMVVVLTTFLSSAYTAPINSTIITSEYSYCNETSSSPNDALHILYNDLDNTLDVLAEVCLNYDEIVRYVPIIYV